MLFNLSFFPTVTIQPRRQVQPGGKESMAGSANSSIWQRPRLTTKVPGYQTQWQQIHKYTAKFTAP